MDEKQTKNPTSFFAELKRRNVVRVAIFYGVASWVVLQVADIVLPALTLPQWSITLVLVLLLLGFPLVLLLAWIFELTPEGLRRDHEVDQTQSIRDQTGRKIDFLIIGVLAIAVTVLLADKFLLRGTPEKTIAVLPFVNMGGTAESAAFSDGLAETLLHMLAQVEGLHVAARTSSFQFREQTGDIAEIARQLRVRNLLEGSVQWSGDSVRVTAQLIDASDGFHLWSGNYNSDLSDIFKIQDDIARQVVKKLRVTLLGDDVQATGNTKNVQAYEAFLQGRHEQTQFSYKSLARAEDHYKQATQLDPEYGLAYLARAEVYFDMWATGLIDLQETWTKVEAPLSRARAIMGETPEVLAITARLEEIKGQLGVELTVEAAEAAYEKALQIDPDNVTALTAYAYFLQYGAQRPHDAIKYASRGLQFDPRSDRLISVYALALQSTGRAEEALAQYQKLRDYYPNSPIGYYHASNSLSQMGRFAEAIKWAVQAAKVDPADPEIPAMIVRNLINVGDIEATGPWLDRSLAISPDAAGARARMLDRYLFTGEREQGLALARQLLDDGGVQRQGARFVALWWLMNEGVRTENTDEFLSYLHRFYPEFAQDDPELTIMNYEYAVLLIPALQAQGDTDRANRLAHRLLKKYAEAAKNTSKENFLEEIIIHSQIGQVDEAIEKLKLMEQNKIFEEFWVFEIEPGVEALLKSPQYQAIKARVDAYLKQQRDQIHANGDHLVPQ